MTPPPAHEYTFFRIPKDDTLRASAQKYQQLRLRALSVAPASFSSTYEIEAAIPEDGWASRLALDGKETFICAATPSTGNRDPAKPGQEGEELWQMLSLFTLPDYRGCGLGKRLCQEALKYLASYRPSPSKVWVRLMVKPENQATVGLYRGLGFGESGKCTLAEALVANGDAELLPADVSGEKYSSRSGLVMMLEFSR
ncbi:GNAT family N-acetyltransferase [Aspergillus aculeatinus CBS 121060]|uniref:Uncharacterized protein n=1 Tax=Aspergillus aculeatinus CBS 121060 TaxID=1448322 RepID=A0ACD1GTQ1_9EURO|nr:hypothetical protein BO66DRAFT_475644 [Aspergillus aculeatinus CBS 121060]RAH64642.1 hypothetical protein BO66DRAFT_475644 [Aspergillus aculeatinus CBS 121060]